MNVKQYYADVDWIFDETPAPNMRVDIGDVRFVARVVQMENCNGNSLVRITGEREPLIEWLKANGYEEEDVVEVGQ